MPFHFRSCVQGVFFFLLAVPLLGADDIRGPYELTSAATGHTWKLDKEFISADAAPDKRPAFYFEPLDAVDASGRRFYRIKTWHGILHADLLGDQRLSTRAVSEDEYTRFLIKKLPDPEMFQISVLARGRGDAAPSEYLLIDRDGKVMAAKPTAAGAIVAGKVRLRKLPWEEMPRRDYAAALTYLNRVRANPPAHSLNNARREEDLPNGQESEDVIGVDLRGVDARPPFRWNDTLHRVALMKAELIARASIARGSKIGSRHRLTVEHLAGTGWESKVMRGEEDEMRELGYIPAGHGENLKGMGRSDPNLQDVGTMAVNALINDFGTEPPGHRYSLLGIGAGYQNNDDLGMATVKYYLTDRWRYRTVIIVGKRAP